MKVSKKLINMDKTTMFIRLFNKKLILIFYYYTYTQLYCIVLKNDAFKRGCCSDMKMSGYFEVHIILMEKDNTF